MQMKAAAVTPRVFTDDLQIIARGPRRLEHFQYAFDQTHKHLHDMGARMAPAKSVTFAMYKTAKKWVKQHRWSRLGKTVVVLDDMRGLGARFNSNRIRRYGTTLVARMRNAATATNRLAKMRTPYATKAKIIRA